MDKIAQVNILDYFDSPFGRTKGLGDFISLLITAAITMAGIILVFLFIFGGFRVISSAGKNDPRGAESGRAAITYAVIGFLIVVFAYFFIRTIEVITGVNFVTEFSFF